MIVKFLNLIFTGQLPVHWPDQVWLVTYKDLYYRFAKAIKIIPPGATEAQFEYQLIDAFT